MPWLSWNSRCGSRTRTRRSPRDRSNRLSGVKCSTPSAAPWSRGAIYPWSHRSSWCSKRSGWHEAMIYRGRYHLWTRADDHTSDPRWCSPAQAALWSSLSDLVSARSSIVLDEVMRDMTCSACAKCQASLRKHCYSPVNLSPRIREEIHSNERGDEPGHNRLVAIVSRYTGILALESSV